jgi:hypothetical protein
VILYILKQETAYNYNYYVHFNVVTFFDVIKGQVRTVGLPLLCIACSFTFGPKKRVIG